MLRVAYGRGIVAQVVRTTNGPALSGTARLLLFVVAIGLAFIPAAIARGKGRSFGLFYLFGFFCFLPALIVSLVISDNRSRNGPFGAGGYGPGGYGDWNPQPGGWVPPGSAPQWGASTPPPPPPPSAPAPPSPPAGWYPDPGGTAQQRYWDGARWTDQLH